MPGSWPTAQLLIPECNLCKACISSTRHRSSRAYGHSLVPQLYKETFIHRKTTNQKCLTQGANKTTKSTLVYNITTEREKQKITLFSSRGGCAYELTLLFEFPVPVSNDEVTPSINVAGGGGYK